MRLTRLFKVAAIGTMAAALIGTPVGSAFAGTKNGVLTVSPTQVPAGSPSQLQLTYTTGGGGGVKCILFTIPKAFTNVTAEPTPVSPTTGWTGADFGKDADGNWVVSLSGGPAIGTGLSGSMKVDVTAPNVTGTYILSATSYTSVDCTKPVNNSTDTTTVQAVPSGGPTLNPTSTTIVCNSGTPVVGVADPCTVTVTDTSGSPTNPTGPVDVEIGSGDGALSGSTCDTPTASGTDSATCSVTYTGSSIGSKILTATYGGDSGHSGSSGSFALTVQAAAAAPGVFRPDLLIKGMGTHAHYIGEGIFTGSGTHQRIHQFVRQGGNTTAWVKIENDGKNRDTIAVGGRTDQAGFKATYWFKKLNISRQVAHHGYNFSLARGAERVIRVVVHAFPAAEVGKERTWQIIGRSLGNPLKRDVVKFATTIR